MNELIRRAMLGNQEAQRECTEKEIVLPCPCCGGEADTWRNGNTVFVECSVCGLTMQDIRESYVLANWNTRPAPPIGRCGECIHYEFGVCLKIYDDGNAHTEAWQHREPDDYCSYFEPKDGGNK